MTLHGTHSAYVGGCRCPDCTEANRLYQADYRARVRRGETTPRTTIEHGTVSCYVNRRCRCEECVEARREYDRLRHATCAPPPSRPDPGPWIADGACRGVDPDLFFPERGQNGTQAKAVCAECPVIDECAAYGMGEAFGIWGGLDAEDRRRIRRKRRRVA